LIAPCSACHTRRIPARDKNAMTIGRKFTVQRTAYFSQEMWTHLEQIAVKRANGTSANDLIREGVRLLIDTEANVLGSRRHFHHPVQQGVNKLESELPATHGHHNGLLLFYLNIVIQMLAFGLAHLLTVVSKASIAPQQLIQRAVIQARKEEEVFAAQIRAV